MEHIKNIPNCPVEAVLQPIGGRWRVLVLRDLFTGIERFNELVHSVGNIIQKILTNHLYAIEQDELLARTAYPEVPPRAEYVLTEAGYGLEPILGSMFTQGSEYKGRI